MQHAPRIHVLERPVRKGEAVGIGLQDETIQSEDSKSPSRLRYGERAEIDRRDPSAVEGPVHGHGPEAAANLQHIFPMITIIGEYLGEETDLAVQRSGPTVECLVQPLEELARLKRKSLGGPRSSE